MKKLILFISSKRSQAQFTKFILQQKAFCIKQHKNKIK